MNRTTSTDDFRQVMEQTAGQDLQWFFRQWLNRAGVPAVSGTWYYDVTTKEVVVTIRQTQAADPYRLALGVGVVQTAGALPVVREMTVDGRETTMRFAAATEPAALVIDPAVSTLAEFGAFVRVPAR